MEDKQYQEIADALQDVCDSRHWRASISTIRDYIRNPGKPYSTGVLPRTKVLIDFGRKNPEAIERLFTLIERIKKHDFDLEAYVSENKEKIDKAFEFLNSLDRPLRVVNSIISYDGDVTKARYSALRGDKGCLDVLVPIAKASMTRFRKMVDARLMIKKEEISTKQNAYLKVFRARRAAQKRLFCYLHNVDELKGELTKEFKKMTSKAALAAGFYSQEHAVNGVSKHEARAKFWEEYDRDLSATIRALDAEERGAKIVRSNIRFPDIVGKYFHSDKRMDKIQKLQQKFKK
ncbi:hypothetical protein [uncultured Parasutterella sp.]|jgi:head-tail adaptor|uniref:hypothetical protein n=1 Tax=uncultured Parasutterella sp. TaxID=1263098 RepID=UPI0020586D37|nr:hypothetical protein [uncultured Parasutterella sp.]DAJ56247.1 MAG TPA: hypothetical protein [Caudoviricetes sp.]